MQTSTLFNNEEFDKEFQPRTDDILCGMVTDTPFCGVLSSFKFEEANHFFISSYARKIWEECKKHYLETKEAPGSSLQFRLQDAYLHKNEETSRLISNFANRLSNVYLQKEPLTTAGLIALSQLHLKRRTKNFTQLNGEWDSFRDLHESCRNKLKCIDPVEYFGEGRGVDYLYKQVPPAVEFLIPNLITVNQQLLICGPAKTLKTMITLCLTDSLVSGKPFLSDTRFTPTKIRNVLYMGGEVPENEIALRLQSIHSGKMPFGDKERDYEGWGKLWYVPRVPKFSNDKDLQVLKGMLEKDNYNFVVIDSAYQSMDGETASNAQLNGNQLAAIGDVCHSCNAQFVLLHHANSMGGNEYRPMEMKDIQYKGYDQYFRQFLLLSRREKYRADGKHPLWMNIMGSSGHTGLYGVDIDEGTLEKRKWIVSVDFGSNIKRSDESKHTNERQNKTDMDVLARLKSFGVPVSARSLRGEGISTDAIQPALDRLFANGLVKKVCGPRNALLWVAV